MTATYDKITAYTAPSAVSSYTFTSIPATYTDLVLIINSTGTGSYHQIQLNSDTGTNYSRTRLSGNGSTASSSRNTSSASIIINDLSSTVPETSILQFQDYANSTTYKTVLYRNNLSTTSTGAGVGLWRSTAAINSIKVYPDTNNFSTGSTFTLYGIKAE
jgi:hypothetical protein